MITQWRKSSRSGVDNKACVEVAQVPGVRSARDADRHAPAHTRLAVPTPVTPDRGH